MDEMSNRKTTLGKSIHDLKQYFDVIPSISNKKKLSVYLIAAEKLLSAGRTCQNRKDYENEYIYKMRYVVFVMKLIKEHNEFSDESMKQQYRTSCRNVINELENLKVTLKEFYEKVYENDIEAPQDELNAQEENENKQELDQSIPKEKHQSHSQETEVVDSAENIKNKEEIKDEITEDKPIADSEFKYVMNKYFSKEKDDRLTIYDELTYESKALNEQQHSSLPLFNDILPPTKPYHVHLNSYAENKNGSEENSGDSFPSFTQTIRGSQFNPDYIHPENLMTYGPTCSHKPSIESNHKPIEHHNQMNMLKHIKLPPPPIVHIKPTSFPILTNQKPIISSNETVSKLTYIEMDGEILDSFMRYANQNTKKSIETCGNLAGVLDIEKNAFCVTHILIPKQMGTTDTCITSNEEDVVDFQIKNDLITLGWIHTHPSQACFLSSIDLHTHFSYQRLFDEAVAIVIAPKDNPNFSIFRLSDYGMNVIENCTQKGFHYHDERALYETCRHVLLRWNVKKYKIVDFR